MLKEFTQSSPKYIKKIQVIQDVDVFNSSSEQILRNLEIQI